MSDQIPIDLSSGDNASVNGLNLEKSDTILSSKDLEEDYEGMPPLEDINPNKAKPTASPAKKPFVIEESASHLTNEDGWLDIIGSGDLKKKVLKPGKGYEHRPTRGSCVEIYVKTYLADGTFIEEWMKTIFQGDNDIVQGLDLALALMEAEEEAEVMVPPRLAYGSVGKLPHIPPNSSLKYNITLMRVRDTIEEPLPVDSLLEIVVYKKNTGNFWYGRKDYYIAVHCYSRALHFLDEMLDRKENETNINQANLLKVNLHNNQALSQINMGVIDAALKSLDCALDIDPANEKSLYRKAKTLADLGQLNDAIALIDEALIITPHLSVLKNLLIELKRKNKLELAKEKEVYQKMFQTKKNKPTVETNNNQKAQVLNNESVEIKQKNKSELAKEEEVCPNTFQTKKNDPTVEINNQKIQGYKRSLIAVTAVLVVVGGILTYKYLY